MLFSQPIMENQSQSTNQMRANIMRQQPVNTTELVTSASIPKPTLEERIRTMESLTKLIPTSTPISQSYAIDITGKCINQSIAITNKTPIVQCQPIAIMANVSNVLSPSTSQTLIQPSSSTMATTLPVLIAPKKSSHSFMQRFTAQNINHQQPECRKVATIPCDLNKEKNITLYVFKDDKRAYEAANDYGRNKYKFGAGIASYFSTIGKVPNKIKFDNEYQKQVWIHMLENVGTYNLYALLGKFDAEENIIIHNVNQVVDIYIGGLKGSIQLGSKRSLQAFELKGRNRNIVIQTTEKRSVLVIESIIMGSELREIIPHEEVAKYAKR